jgi:hypothetical protein
MTLRKSKMPDMERPQGRLPLRPSAIAARLYYVEPRPRVLAALGPHSREGGISMKRPSEDAALRRAQGALQ